MIDNGKTVGKKYKNLTYIPYVNNENNDIIIIILKDFLTIS